VGIQLDETAAIFGSDTTPSLAAYTKDLRSLLGVWPEPQFDQDRSLANVLVALTPLIRSRFLFPTEAVHAELSVSRLPFVLLALHKILALARQAGQEITYQTVQQMLGSFEPMLRVLAYADRPMAWNGKASINLSRTVDQHSYASYVRTAKQLLPSAQVLDQKTLVELLKLDGDDICRLTELNEVCKRLVGKIGTMDNRADLRPATYKLRLQRLLLRTVDSEMLWTLAPKWWAEHTA
jgi:hypothetical protein